MTQPEALRLAAELTRYLGCGGTASQAAAELRRLSIENEAFGLHLSERMTDLAKVEAQRDALLEALREYRAAILFAQDKQALMSAIKSADDKARAAIAKAEEA